MNDEKIIRLTCDEQELFSDALSDVLCWMDGFRAAGGVFSPGSLERLRDLSIKIKGAANE